MTGLFSKLNKRLTPRSSSSDTIPIARIINNKPVPENATASELDKLVSAPLESAVASEQAAEVAQQDPWSVLLQLISDPTVTDIFIAAPEVITCRKNGVHSSTELILNSASYSALCEACESQIGVRCTAANNIISGSIHSPIVARISMTNPAINLTEWMGIHLRIPRVSPTFYDLIKAKMLPASLASWLTAALASRCVHIVVCGAPHSGKTTLTATLAHAAPSEERIIALEPCAEISPPSRRVDRLKTSAVNAENRNLLILATALQSAPDRLIAADIAVLNDPISNTNEAAFASQVLNCGVPSIIAFASATAESVTDYLKRCACPLPILVLETHVHDHQPLVRQVLEITNQTVTEVAIFHSVKENKRLWLRSPSDGSVVHELLAKRGQELKVTSNLLDVFPDNE